MIGKSVRAWTAGLGLAGLGLLLWPASARVAAQSPAAASPTAQVAATAKPAVRPVSMPDVAGVGEALYLARCAACHDHAAETRAPSRDNLAAMSADRIHFALTGGIMQAQGVGLGDDQRAQLIGYLTKRTEVGRTDWAVAMTCPSDRRTVSLKAAAPVTGFGYDRDNTRSLTARQAGLTKAQLSDMELAWAIAIPGGASMRTQPAVVGTTVFLPVAEDHTVYAFDVSQPLHPCVQWTYKAPGSSPLRTSPAYGVLAGGRGVLALAGQDTTLHVLDARTGAPLWTKKVGTFAYSMTTGTPTVLKDRIIVPVSQFEIAVAAANTQTCCNNHGYVLALDPKDGRQLWRYDTMEDAKAIRDRGDGKMMYGPSGAPIWNSPAVDEKRRLIYFGTGEANSLPAHRNTDAIIAIGLDDGREKWSLQATARDVFVMGCAPQPKPTQLNCTGDTVFRDVDFGASMIRARLRPGVDAVFGGQKSGTVWALDPATGKVIWRNALGTGSPLGGVHWGLAHAGGTVFAPIAAVGRSLPGEPVDPERIKSGLYALDAATGAVKWSFATQPDCTGDRPKRMPSCGRLIGMSAAPAVIDGAVVEGGLDGFLYVLDARDGRLLWKFDTAVHVNGINGVEGAGGSIDTVSIAAADGLLFTSSGYGAYGGKAGNLFMAFRPRSAPPGSRAYQPRQLRRLRAAD